MGGVKLYKYLSVKGEAVSSPWTNIGQCVRCLDQWICSGSFPSERSYLLILLAIGKDPCMREKHHASQWRSTILISVTSRDRVYTTFSLLPGNQETWVEKNLLLLGIQIARGHIVHMLPIIPVIQLFLLPESWYLEGNRIEDDDTVYPFIWVCNAGCFWQLQIALWFESFYKLEELVLSHCP